MAPRRSTSNKYIEGPKRGSVSPNTPYTLRKNRPSMQQSTRTRSNRVSRRTNHPTASESSYVDSSTSTTPTIRALRSSLRFQNAVLSPKAKIVTFTKDVNFSDGRRLPKTPAISSFQGKQSPFARTAQAHIRTKEDLENDGIRPQPRSPQIWRRASSAGNMADRVDAYLDTVIQHQYDSIMIKKIPETIEEMAIVLKAFKQELKRFVNTLFKFSLSPEQKAAFSLSELAARAPYLFNYLNYIGDASKYGWETLFTDESNRTHLAFALVGKVVETHILNHTFFGASANALSELHALDQEHINLDAFVRVSERAELLKKCALPRFGEDPLSAATAIIDTKEIATATHEHLLLPLLTLMFPPDSDGIPSNIRQAHDQSLQWLNHILVHAAQLNHCIRLANLKRHGRKSIIYVWRSTPKFADFNANEHSCKNKAEIDATEEDGDKLVISLSMFPALYAYESIKIPVRDPKAEDANGGKAIQPAPSTPSSEASTEILSHPSLVADEGAEEDLAQFEIRRNSVLSTIWEERSSQISPFGGSPSSNKENETPKRNSKRKPQNNLQEFLTPSTSVDDGSTTSTRNTGSDKENKTPPVVRRSNQANISPLASRNDVFENSSPLRNRCPRSLPTQTFLPRSDRAYQSIEPDNSDRYPTSPSWDPYCDPENEHGPSSPDRCRRSRCPSPDILHTSSAPKTSSSLPPPRTPPPPTFGPALLETLVTRAPVLLTWSPPLLPTSPPPFPPPRNDRLGLYTPPLRTRLGLSLRKTRSSVLATLTLPAKVLKSSARFALGREKYVRDADDPFQGHGTLLQAVSRDRTGGRAMRSSVLRRVWHRGLGNGGARGRYLTMGMLFLLGVVAGGAVFGGAGERGDQLGFEMRRRLEDLRRSIAEGVVLPGGYLRGLGGSRDEERIGEM